MLGKFRGSILLKFVLSVVSSRCLYVHACFFFLYLSFSLSFVSPLHTSFALSLSILFTYICMHTRLFSRAHNGIQHARARARHREHVYTQYTLTQKAYAFSLSRIQARAHARIILHIHTLIFILSLLLLACSFFRWIVEA